MRLSYTIILFTFHKFNNFSILYVTQDQIAKPTHYSGKKIHPQNRIVAKIDSSSDPRDTETSYTRKHMKVTYTATL